MDMKLCLRGSSVHSRVEAWERFSLPSQRNKIYCYQSEPRVETKLMPLFLIQTVFDRLRQIDPFKRWILKWTVPILKYSQSLWIFWGKFGVIFFYDKQSRPLIRWLLQEPSNLGLHCLQRCLNSVPAVQGLTWKTRAILSPYETL